MNGFNLILLTMAIMHENVQLCRHKRGVLSRVLDSIQERARYFVKGRQTLKLKQGLGVPADLSADLETLMVLASVKVHLGHKVDLLVDVGAHKGAFVVPAMQILSAQEALCIEPNPEMLPILSAALNSYRAKILPYALDKEEGETSLHVHQDPSMSSLLISDPNVLKRDFATYDIADVHNIKIKVTTLDLVLSEYVSAGRRFFLKLDTQGTELTVLEGGKHVLACCDGILTEYMFATPYKNQPSFERLVTFLNEAGFHCAATLEIKRRPSHRVSGVDFLFLPNDVSSDGTNCLQVKSSC